MLPIKGAGSAGTIQAVQLRRSLISQQAPLVRQGSTKASLQCRRPYTAQRLVISASQQVPGEQFRQEEAPGQSAGSLSDAGEHEGQSTVQTPLVSYTAQRLASSADAPDQRSLISRHHTSSSDTKRSLVNQQAP